MLEFRANLHAVTNTAFVLLRSSAYNLAVVIWSFYFLRRREVNWVESLPSTDLASWNESLTQHVDKMVSTLIILLVSALVLWIAWVAARPGLLQIRSLDDWDAKKKEVDLTRFACCSIPRKSYIFENLFPRLNSVCFKGGALPWRCARSIW